MNDKQANSGKHLPVAPLEFRNARAVSTWLKAQGWAIGKSRVYDHIKEGKLRPDLPDGCFSLKAVQKYAATHLMRSGTRQHLKDEALQRRKVMAEIEKTETEAKRSALKLHVDEGRYVLREEMDRLLAGRGVAMHNKRMADIMNYAAERVALVGGDPGRVPDLIAFDMRRHEEDMNSFCDPKEFHSLLPANAAGETYEDHDRDH